ncbi:ABC transporter permease subunit [Candidatus Sumerlaeota bacterium]
MSARPMRRLLAPTFLVATIAWLDFVRRKDLYVIAIFMLLFVAATFVLRIVGVREQSTAHFLMSAGLTLSHLLAAFVAASFSARAFPEELERRMLPTLLAKPVRRAEVLGGKALTCLALALGGYLLFVAATLVAVPWAAGHRLASLAQVVVLQSIGLILLSAMAMFLSLFLPALVAALIAMTCYFGSGLALNVVSRSLEAGGSWTPLMEKLLACLPNPTLLFHLECFAGGSEPLRLGLFAGLACYGLLWAVAFYAWAMWKLERISL